MHCASHASLISPLDDRLIAAIRLILAASAFVLTYMDPSAPNRYVAATYTALALYVAYSATLCACTGRCIPGSLAAMAHWVDVGWYVTLSGLSSGTHSIFFLFFAILVASFQWGFVSGLRVALISAALCSVVGFATASAEPGFALNRLLLQPTVLLVLGAMIAYWGGREVALKRRLTLLKDVSTLANPRFGVDYTLGALMEQLRAFYDADACLLVMADPLTGGHRLRRVDRRDPAAATRCEPISEELAHRLLELPATQAAVARGAPRLWAWWRPEAGVRVYDVETDEFKAVPPQVSGVLAAASCITVPWRQYRETSGRLYLTASRRRTFDASDVRFLLQLLEHAVPVIENIQLVDQLASAAAETERQRMARDLHDSVIQPYIGLQMGLTAVCQKLAAGSPDVRGDLKQLLVLTDLGLADLYRYTGGLKERGERGGSLLPAVRRFAERFAKTTGIAVHVEAQTSLGVHDRLAAEAFHIVAEGLSNVRRHTRSAQATIGLACCNGHLMLRIVNDIAAGSAPAPFMPRSITERAAALGGCTRVEPSAGSVTVVVVDIPL